MTRRDKIITHTWSVYNANDILLPFMGNICGYKFYVKPIKVVVCGKLILFYQICDKDCED